MKTTKIVYQASPDNSHAVVDFIGGVPECKTCGGTGEYETEYGPAGCQLCNSRLINFIDASGKMVYADWGDEIVKDDAGGLHLIKIEDCSCCLGTGICTDIGGNEGSCMTCNGTGRFKYEKR